MQYSEFLALTGASEKECELDVYQAFVAPAYMENDDLFPTKKVVVEYWHNFGLLGFTPERIQAIRSLIDSFRKQFCWGNGDPAIKNPMELLNVIGRAAFGIH